MAKRKFPETPVQVKLGSKVAVEIVHVSEFPNDDRQIGEWRPQQRQIAIKTGLSSREEFSTVIHELFHFLSDECDIKLTETQVYKLEKATLKLLISNDWI